MITLYTSFPTNKGLTLTAYLRGRRLSMPAFPRGKLNLRQYQKAAARQVVWTLRLLAETGCVLHLRNYKHRLFIPSSFLFPRLAALSRKLGDKPITLQTIWGKYSNRVIQSLLVLPAENVMFFLDAHDQPHDASLLSQLAIQKLLTPYRCLLTRPILAEHFQPKRVLQQRITASITSNEPYACMIIQCNQAQRQAYLAGQPGIGRNLRLAAKLQRQLIFD